MDILHLIVGELIAWSKLVRENFQIVLLAIMYSACIILLLHVFHHQSDTDLLAYIEGAATGLASAFFALMKVGKTGEPAASTTTTTTVSAVGGPPIPPIPEAPKPESK